MSKFLFKKRGSLKKCGKEVTLNCETYSNIYHDTWRLHCMWIVIGEMHFV